MKVEKLALPALVLALFASMFAQRQLAAVTQSCPTGWVGVLNGKGVMVCDEQNAAATQQPLVGYQTVGAIPYVNSWLGNTYGRPEDHIAHTIDNLYVTPAGKVATITGWDEGGANVALYSSSGAKLGIPVESGTGSWGRVSGTAVFVDDQYLYQTFLQGNEYGDDPHQYPQGTAVWKGIRRYHHDGTAAPFEGGKGYDGSMLVVDSSASDSIPRGVVVYNNELYVSDPIAGQIKVYNAATMSSAPVRSFPVANPGLLDYDRRGFIWMLDTIQKKLIRFSPLGLLQPQSIRFPSAVTPTAFSVDKVSDRILVTNNGADQNVLVYTSITKTPAQTSTFGATGGINSGTSGTIAPLKFSEPRGIGIDSSGNIFIGNNGVMQGGARLEKYTAAGVLQWRLNGLIFTDNGSSNPSNETEFYTKEFKFSLNLASTTPGSEWSPAAMTLNKVKYPGDVRIPAVDDQFWTTAYARNLSGKKLLYIADMYGGSLAIYRFNATTDGETAIPSGRLDMGDPATIWRDANGNGANDPGETTRVNNPNDYSTHLFPDSNRGIWKANRNDTPVRIRYFPLQGFDKSGNPHYTFGSSREFAPDEIVDVKRLEYDATNDVLYAIGRSDDSIDDAWWSAGNRMVRYNNPTDGGTIAWSISLPYSTTDTDNNVKAFAEAGDYLFLIAAKEGRIYVHRKSDGTKIGEILPTASTGNRSGWADINGAIRATKRSNGEYLIFAEENGNAKIMMYRWNPGKTVIRSFLSIVAAGPDSRIRRRLTIPGVERSAPR